MEPRYDRSAEDVGNIVNLGHLNLCIGDQIRSTNFYISGLGMTRDPYMNTGTNNMWVNVGVSQFHLPTGKPEHFRGVTGLVVPDRAELLARLERVKKELEGTAFAFRDGNDAVETVCPWGNRLRLHAPGQGALRARVALEPGLSGISTCAPVLRRGSRASIARYLARRRSSKRTGPARLRKSRSAPINISFFRRRPMRRSRAIRN